MAEDYLDTRFRGDSMTHEFPVDWSQVKAGDVIYVGPQAWADYCGNAEMIGPINDPIWEDE
jgi:hypothetical protein